MSKNISFQKKNNNPILNQKSKIDLSDWYKKTLQIINKNSANPVSTLFQRLGNIIAKNKKAPINYDEIIKKKLIAQLLKEKVAFHDSFRLAKHSSEYLHNNKNKLIFLSIGFILLVVAWLGITIYTGIQIYINSIANVSLVLLAICLFFNIGTVAGFVYRNKLQQQLQVHSTMAQVGIAYGNAKSPNKGGSKYDIYQELANIQHQIYN